jgi:hypothetical protein
VCWVVVVFGALLLVHGSGLRGFCHGERDVFRSIARVFFLKVCLKEYKDLVGSTVIALVVESLMVARLRWSLALGWRPAAVLLLL